MRYGFRTAEDTLVSLDLERAPDGPAGSFLVRVGDAERRVEVLRREGTLLLLRVDGRVLRAHVVADGEERTVKLAGAPAVRLERDDGRGGRKRARARGDEALAAAMTSQVVRVAVEAGATVERGDTLVVLEAMKMESRIVAPSAGVVRAVLCQAGQVVERGQPLVDFEPS